MFRVRYESPEAITEASQRDGWMMEYNQVGRGSFASNYLMRPIGDCMLAHEFHSTRIEFSATPPHGMVVVSITSPGETAPYRFNGCTPDPSTVMIFKPTDELDVITMGATGGFSFMVPEVRFRSTAGILAPDLSVDDLESELTATPEVVQDIRRKFQRILCDDADVMRPAVADDLIADVITVAASSATTANDASSIQGHRRTVVARAKSYIEAHLGGDLLMHDICRHCAVSLRSLQRHFKDETGLSVKDFIIMLRMNRIRRDLLRADPETASIREIIQVQGVNHPSLFSRTYRSFFNELPRETLRR